MSISEPSTVVTDLMLAAWCVWLAWRLLAAAAGRGRDVCRLWAGAFLLLGLAAADGAVVHGFGRALEPALARGLWQVVIWSVAGASLLFVVGAARIYLPARGAWVVAVAAVAKLAAFGWWRGGGDDFRYVILDYGLSLVVVLLLAVYGFSKRDPSAPWVALGVLVSFAAAGIQQSGFDLARHLNHNDLYHLVEMVGLYLFYRGALEKTR